ncbi:MAG: hypothetical protein IJY19_01005 [Ruminococcus sp.]|nr:hypothetical protein [Ruminococcus sp.]
MLDTTQVNELREKDFYNSTYKIPYNIKFYKEIKRPKNCSVFSMHKIILTIIKIVWCLVGLFKNIKSFARFRNNNLELFLNKDIQFKDIINNLENNNWLKIEKHDFVQKIDAMKTSTNSIYNDTNFILEIKEILKENFDANNLAEIIEDLTRRYDIIINAWCDCLRDDALSFRNLRNKYNESIKKSEQFCKNMNNGALTDNNSVFIN